MSLKCVNCQYSIINQDDDPYSSKVETTKFFCRNCDNVYCSSRCKIEHYTDGYHKYACGSEAFKSYEGCDKCQRKGEFGPVCQACSRFEDAYRNGGGVHCQQKGPRWSEKVNWGAIYEESIAAEGMMVGGTEKILPCLIKKFGGCTCCGAYDCISPTQTLRFSWRCVGAINISFDGCCPVTVMDAFQQIGELYMRKNATPGQAVTSEQMVATYKNIDSYWQHKAKILFLLQRHLSMGLWLARCADLAYVTMDLHIATAKFKEVGKLAEKTGFQVLEHLATKGLGRIALKQGDSRNASRLLLNSYNMIPFMNGSADALHVYKVSGQQHLLEAMIQCVWDDNSELSPWEKLLSLKLLYDEFHTNVCFAREKAEKASSSEITPGLWEYRTLFCMKIKATLAEHVESIPLAVSAYLELVNRGIQSVATMKNQFFITDIRWQMRDALRRVEFMTTAEDFLQIKTSLMRR